MKLFSCKKIVSTNNLISVEVASWNHNLAFWFFHFKSKASSMCLQHIDLRFNQDFLITHNKHILNWRVNAIIDRVQCLAGKLKPGYLPNLYDQDFETSTSLWLKVCRLPPIIRIKIHHIYLVIGRKIARSTAFYNNLRQTVSCVRLSFCLSYAVQILQAASNSATGEIYWIKLLTR